MFELNIDALKEQGLQFVDTAKKTAINLADKGKNQLDLVEQQAKLSKAQRQLGALVHSLHKSGEENQPLVEKYLAAIDEIEKEIEAIKARMTPDERVEADKAEATEEPVVPQEPVAAPEPEEPAVEEEAYEDIASNRETKDCPVCGAKVDVDALFCNHCGAQL
ncbi:MAG: zinc-ribbon domain-containing protein [Gemmiger sp.]